MKVKNEKLTPCAMPWCNSTDSEIIKHPLRDGGNEYAVECQVCGFSTDYFMDKKEAVAQWNERYWMIEFGRMAIEILRKIYGNGYDHYGDDAEVGWIGRTVSMGEIRRVIR